MTFPVMITWIKTRILCIWDAGHMHGANLSKSLRSAKSIAPIGSTPKALPMRPWTISADLYQVEKEARRRELDAVQIYQLRQEKAKPLLDKFKDWLETKQPLTPPKGLLGQAISYTLSNWEKLIIYLEDGRLRPDNNLVENAIRPFVVGRKNWLFAGSPDGARASATFFTLIETAKANGLEPYAYLRHIFEKLPLAQSEQDLKDLLPQNIDPKSIAVRG